MKLPFISLLLAVGVICVEPSQAQSSLIAPPDEVIEGFSQAEWSRAWWQWAGSFEMDESPVADQSGALCGGKQRGAVWFLAGTYGTQRTIRTCKVPAGKYLFFPLINYVVMPRPGGNTTCAGVKRTAALITNNPSALILDIDGVRTENLVAHRQGTQDCFDMGTLTRTKIRIFPAAANGYYVMLRPLSRGTHVLNFGGALPNMLQAVTYTLQVE